MLGCSSLVLRLMHFNYPAKLAVDSFSLGFSRLFTVLVWSPNMTPFFRAHQHLTSDELPGSKCFGYCWLLFFSVDHDRNFMPI